MYLELAGW